MLDEVCLGCRVWKQDDSNLCPILQKKNYRFATTCPCRSCIVKVTCDFSNRMIIDKGFKVCPEFTEFMATIVDYYFLEWKKGNLKHVKPLRLERSY